MIQIIRMEYVYTYTYRQILLPLKMVEGVKEVTVSYSWQHKRNTWASTPNMTCIIHMFPIEANTQSPNECAHNCIFGGNMVRQEEMWIGFGGVYYIHFVVPLEFWRHFSFDIACVRIRKVFFHNVKNMFSKRIFSSENKNRLSKITVELKSCISSERKYFSAKIDDFPRRMVFFMLWKRFKLMMPGD